MARGRAQRAAGNARCASAPAGPVTGGGDASATALGASPGGPGLPLDPPPRATLAAAAALGASAVTTQLLAVRELMGVFAGNELVFGLVLASWLALGAAGAALGRWAGRVRDRVRLLALGLAALAFLPALHLLAVRLLRNVVLPPGAMAGAGQVLGLSLALLAPYCVASGLLFTVACLSLSRARPDEGIGEAYLAEAAGGVAGGVAFSFVLVHVAGPFATAAVVLALDLAAAAHIALASGRGRLGSAAAVALVASLAIFSLLDLELATTRVLFSSPAAVAAALPTLGDALAFARDPSRAVGGLANVAFVEDSPYGRLVVTREADQLTFWESGSPLFSTGDAESREETVHYALLQHPAPRTVLIVSGGVGGSALEALKHGVERVDYVELDPLVIEAGRLFTANLASPRILVHAMDGRRFVREQGSRADGERYDAVIVDLPEPATTQLNRFYTREFVAEVRRILRPGGVLSLGASGLASYVSEDRRRLNSAIHRTLAAQFANVTIVPGWRTFFIGADRPLSRDIPRLVEERGIETTYVRREFLAPELSPERLALADSSVAEPGPENTDLRPVTSYYALRLWMAYFEGSQGLAVMLAAIAAAAAVAAVALRPVPRAVLAAGLAGSAVEVVLVVAFQTVHGYAFGSMGVLVAAFMAGLALGARYSTRAAGARTHGRLAALLAALATLAVTVPTMVSAMARLPAGPTADALAPLAFPMLNLAAGALVGAVFPLAASLLGGEAARTASTLSAADLAGSCAGALAVSSLLVPLLGIPAVCALVAAACLAAAVPVLRAG